MGSCRSGRFAGSWSSGYDVALTQRRPPVRIRPSPSDNDPARFGPLIAPAPCSGDHSDLERLDRLYALRLASEPLPTSEPKTDRPQRTPSGGPAWTGPHPILGSPTVTKAGPNRKTGLKGAVVSSVSQVTKFGPQRQFALREVPPRHP